MKKRLPIIFALLLSILTLLGSVSSAWAEDIKHELTIGISASPGYAWPDASGTITGSDVEYAYRIAQYANLNVKILLIKEGEDYFGFLDSGKVDILFDAMKTPERQAKYLYADREIGNTPLVVAVRKDDTRFEYGRPEQLKGRTFGAFPEANVGEMFKAWCLEQHINANVRYFSSMEELNKAIDAGDVAGAIFGTDTTEGFRTIQLFTPQSYYTIFRKTDVELRDKVNTAMTNILAEDPLYPDKLQQKYASPKQYEMTVLTRREKNYINENPLVSVAVVKRDEPYFYTDSDGNPRGIVPDFYAKIAEQTTLKFKFVLYENHTEAVRAVANGETDVLGMYSDGLINAHNMGLRLTRAYATVNMVSLTHTNAINNAVQTVAIKHRTRNTLSDALVNDKRLQLVTYATGTDCFEALKDNKVNSMICGQPTATFVINQNSTGSYSVMPVSRLTVDLCGAVRYDNAMLCSILNKAIRSSSNYFDGIVANNTAPRNNIATLMARIPPFFIAIFTIIMFCLVAGLGFALYTLNKRQKEKTAIMAEKANTEKQRIRLEAIEKSAEEKNKFFSDISHDMRTPLNAIIGFAALAEKEITSTQARDYLKKIHSSGELLLDLINDTLTISKLSSGKLAIRLEPVAPDEIFNSVVIPIKEAASKKHLEFITENNIKDCPTLLADKLNLEKIILNLLTNAVKYTPDGGRVRFTMNITDKDAKTVNMQLIIRDSGIGISKSFLPHIYDPFAQEQRPGYEGSGTGLGLAIVKQLTDLMGGTINVISVKNEGTTFTIDIPLTKGTVAPVKAVMENIRQTDEVWQKHEGKKILLCEDNPLNREIASALLVNKGLVVIAAENGQVGVNLFGGSAEGEVAAILMDLRMPSMDGLEATKTIRSSSRADAKTVPIIAMTADVFAEDIQKCLDAGMNDHIAKPINPEKLYEALLKVL